MGGRLGGVRAQTPMATDNFKERFEMTKDPVCGMSVDDNSPNKSTNAGQSYVFCSPGCKTKFDNEPERYLVPAGAVAQAGGVKDGCC